MNRKKGYVQISEGVWRSFFAAEDYRNDQELADRVGVSRSTVAMARKRFNIPPATSVGGQTKAAPVKAVKTKAKAKKVKPKRKKR